MKQLPCIQKSCFRYLAKFLQCVSAEGTKLIKRSQKPNWTFLFISIQFILLISLPAIGAHLPSWSSEKNDGEKHILQGKGGELYRNHPVLFIENKGQMCDMEGGAVPFVFFKAEAPGMDLYVTETGISYFFMKMEEGGDVGEKENEKANVKWERVEMKINNAEIKKENILAEDPESGYRNYFMPNCKDGLYGVREYKKITILNVYPGIDWVLYNSSASGFKYDFVVHPGSDPSVIKIIYESEQPLVIDQRGNMSISCDAGTLHENAPYTYLSASGKELESQFKMDKQKMVGGHIETHISIGVQGGKAAGKGETLVIDPQLTWSSYYGGSSFDGTYSVDTDDSGNVFIGGYTASPGFPVLNSGTYFQGTFLSGNLAFICKFNAAGVRLWATFYGATQSSSTLYALTCDNLGNLYCTGFTTSPNFPVQNAGGFFKSTLSGGDDMFILKFDNSGNRLWATFYGGTAGESPSSIATDASGNVFICGYTSSTNFPVQNAGGYFQATMSGLSSGCFLKFDNLSNRLWASYYNYLNPEALTIDNSGNLFVTGTGSVSMNLMNPGGGAYFQGTVNGASDAAVLKFTNGSNLLWATYLGGSATDNGKSVRCDASNNLFVTGATASPNFPLQNAGTYFKALPGSSSPILDIFISKFNPTGNLTWSTYFGGNDYDGMSSTDNLEIDSCGNICLAFETKSPDLPVLQDCMGGYIDSTYESNVSVLEGDLFITRFSNTGVHLWGSYFGGNGYDFRSPIDLDKKGNLYVSGEWVNGTLTATYPIADPGGGAFMDTTANGSDDVFISRFAINPQMNFSYPGQICVGGPVSAPILSSGFVMGGVFSAPPGLSLNPSTGQVNPSISNPGSYTVSYNLPAIVATCICLPASAQVVSTLINVNTPPTVSISAPPSGCVGQTIALTGAGASTYTWSTGAQGQSISPLLTTSTIFTVSGSGANGCSSTASVAVSAVVCTGVAENEKPRSVFKIYPNPNSGEFRIEGERSLDLILYSETGQLLRNIQLISGNRYTVFVKGLSAGIYFICKEGESTGEGQKIVVTE